MLCINNCRLSEKVPAQNTLHATATATASVLDQKVAWEAHKLTYPSLFALWG